MQPIFPIENLRLLKGFIKFLESMQWSQTPVCRTHLMLRSKGIHKTWSARILSSGCQLPHNWAGEHPGGRGRPSILAVTLYAIYARSPNVQLGVLASEYHLLDHNSIGVKILFKWKTLQSGNVHKCWPEVTRMAVCSKCSCAVTYLKSELAPWKLNVWSHSHSSRLTFF